MVPRPMRPAAALLPCLLLACAGERRPPAPRPDPLPASAPEPDAAAPAPEKAVVPRGCDINLAGHYRLQKRPALRYLVEDDGTHLVARPAAPDDAGTDDSMGLVADRTARGFVGLVVGYARTPSGARCPVTFKAEIVACDPGGLTVRSEDAVSLDDECRIRRPAGAATEKVLVRE